MVRLRYERTYSGPGGEAFGAAMMVLMVSFALSLFAAWGTHIVWIIRKLAGDAGVTMGQVALGVLGSFMPPVGIIHGYMIWFGVGF